MTRQSLLATLMWVWVAAALAAYLFQFRQLIDAVLRTLGLA